MRMAEQLLRALSRPAEADDLNHNAEAWNLETALSLLERVYPSFVNSIVNKTVLDFGCGYGWQVLAMAQKGAKFAVGIESESTVLDCARKLACNAVVPLALVRFYDALDPELDGKFDLVISQNAMEHFMDPSGVIRQMKRALKPDGKILITFGPPWLAPYGSHMHFFTKVPWVNVWFSEKTVMAVRRFFRDDGATRYDQIRKGLNQMTLGTFERIVADCGMRPLYWKLEAVKGIDWLSRVPILREFFVNHVTCLLARMDGNSRKASASRHDVVLTSSGRRP